MIDSAKIILSGTGGQGVKSLANILGALLIQKGYAVSVLVNYDSASRGGTIYAYLVFDKKEVSNPIVDKADFLLELGMTPREFRAKKIIRQKGIHKVGEADFYEFAKLGKENFGKPIYGNSIALGLLWKYLEGDLSEIDVRAAIPKKLPDDNVDAVKLGFELKK